MEIGWLIFYVIKLLESGSILNYQIQGKAHPNKDTVKQTVMYDKNGKELPVVTLEFILEHSVETKLYHYITNE
ncbi:MAG TPA: DUF3427 domain-containing protein [Bacillus sp. (in: firmicutes)]|nr:DUF3427 domain-containing protein [Bacillus sp. (in: firmicutes)]